MMITMIAFFSFANTYVHFYTASAFGEWAVVWFDFYNNPLDFEGKVASEFLMRGRKGKKGRRKNIAIHKKRRRKKEKA